MRYYLLLNLLLISNFWLSIFAANIDDVNGTTQTLTCGSTETLLDDGGAGFYAWETVTYEVTYQISDLTQYLSLNVTQMQIHSTDELRIYEGIGTSGTLLESYSNINFSSTDIRINTSTTAITFQFIKNSGGTASGFSIGLSCASEPILPNRLTSTETYTFDCSTVHTLYDESGPGSTQYIDNDEDYSITLNPSDASQYLYITLKEARISANDELRIYEGTSTGTVLRRFSGTGYNGVSFVIPVTTAGSSLTIEFIKNSTGVSNGFEIDIQCSNTAIMPTEIVENASYILPCGSTHTIYDDAGGNASTHYLDETRTYATSFTPNDASQYLYITLKEARISANDELRIYEGTSTGTVLRRFSGTGYNGVSFVIPVSTAGASLTIEFVKNSTGTFNGFELEIQCSSSPVIPTEIVESASYTIPCGSSYTIYDDAGGDASTHYLDETRTYTTSFTPDDASQYLKITFSQMNLGAGDELRVYEGTTSGTLLKTYMGSYSDMTTRNHVIPLQNAGQTLTLEFVKTASSTFTGFTSVIECVSSIDVIPNMMMDAGTYTLPCGTAFNFYDTHGAGGSFYNENMTGTYITEFIPEESTAYVQVTFSGFFGLGAGDTLRVYDGSTLLATYAGNVPLAPNPILGTVTANNPLRFEFYSDGSASWQGWEATIECVSSPVVPNVITNGTIMAPCSSVPYTLLDPSGSGTSHYKNNEDYIVLIEPESSTGYVSITMNSLRLSTGDEVNIYLGNSTDPSDLLHSFTNANSFSTPPFVVASPTAGIPLTLRFTTDASGTWTGWEADLSCSENIVLPNILIDGYTYEFNCTEVNTIYDPSGPGSSHYPDNYSATMNYVNNYTDRFLRLDFSNIRVSTGDVLNVYENGVFLTTIAVGASSPTSTTVDLAVGADLRLEFITNSSANWTGWELQISSIENTSGLVGGRRYWISNTNDNWSCSTCWSSTSGGVSDGLGPPAGECAIAVFDANGSGRCTLDQNVDGSNAIYGMEMNDYAEKLDIQGSFDIEVSNFITMNGGEIEINSGSILLNQDKEKGFAVSETQIQETIIDINGGEMKVGDYNDSKGAGVHSSASLFMTDASTLDISNGILSVSDRLIISDNSTFNLSGGDVYVKRATSTASGNSGAKFILGFNANMNMTGGNLNIQGVFDATSTNPAFSLQKNITNITGGTFILSNISGAFKSYYINSSGFTLPNIQINLGSSNDIVTLDGNMNVNGQIDLTQGKIDLNGQIIDLGSTGTLINETNDNRIFGTAGYIEAVRNITTSTTGNIANLGFQINSLDSDLGSTTLRRGHTQQTNSLNGGFGINRYFTLTPTTDSDGDITIHYFDDELAGITESELVAWKQNTSTLHWENKKGTQVNIGSSGLVQNITEQTELTTLWTLGSSINNPLPLTLMSFNASAVDNSVKLEWQTISEKDVSHFEIERSKDAQSFETISSLDSKGGNELTTYTFWDNQPLLGLSYYRLKMIDTNNTFEYSPTLAIDFSKGDILKVYPNPSRDYIYLQFPQNFKGNVKVEIIDISGKLLFESEENIVNNKYKLTYNKIPTGTYILKISGEQKTWTKKIIIL